VTGAAVRVAAQAKVNLHLRVLAREDSGFHSLETIFHRIELADELTIRTTGGSRTLDVQGGATGNVEANLAWLAAERYRAESGWPNGFDIELTKRIPVGAGLGGGSADAAAVLRALDALSPNPMGSHGLLRVAASLGSDVSFLASDAVMALAWGRGERMLAFAPLPRRHLLLLTPEFSVSTAEAYQWLDELRDIVDDDKPPGPDAPLLLSPSALTSWESIAQLSRNDFEAVVIARYPALGGQLERLREHPAIMAHMTGSGSTLFGVFDSPPNSASIHGEEGGRVIMTMTSIDVVQPERVG